MSTDPSLLATPEELAARQAAAAADTEDKTPYETLAGSHDELTDDELAEAIAAHPDRDLLLALWRRVRGEKPAAEPGPAPQVQTF